MDKDFPKYLIDELILDKVRAECKCTTPGQCQNKSEN